MLGYLAKYNEFVQQIHYAATTHRRSRFYMCGGSRLSCSYFTRLWSKKSVSISPPGKRAINLSRLHYRLLTVCCSCFCINFLLFNLHRFLLPFSLEQALVRLQLFLRYFNNAFSVDACESTFSDFL